MRKSFLTILAVVLLSCVLCPFICFADETIVGEDENAVFVPADLECGAVNDDLIVYVTNNGTEPVTISPMFASYNAESGRVESTKVWSNITIEPGQAYEFNLSGRFDETRLNKFFFFGSTLNPVRDSAELVAEDNDIIFDVGNLYP